jgi:puromycin-sensitive aminopeptidase
MNTKTTPLRSVPADEALWRLPTAVRPIRYDLLLAPDVKGATFSGTVRIECSVSVPTSEIVLNAVDLEIESTAVESLGRSLAVTSVTVDEEGERLTIAVGELLSSDEEFSVEVKFHGTLNDLLCGFYRSIFSPTGAIEGTLETIATTHFEPTDARRAFPCFDEPDLKAVFSVTVDVPEGLSVFSNWSVASEEPLASGGRRVHFGDTIPMSTYLVAVVVGPLEQTPPMDVDGTPVSVVHVPGKGHLTDFALEAAAHSIRFFNEWFGIPYPAAKLDLVALPDFAMGAMENLGCVTFRESALLVDPAHASTAELQRVAQVVEHEIAHMWFGDLVTMRWWDGIWLNEAFATFMELACGDDLRPDWDIWTGFGTKREMAMAIDALHSTRPIEYPVGKPEEAEGMFDPLTYEKGAGVLRMLEQYIGAEQFREGIRTYLKRHSYGNTDTHDLWAAIEEASGEQVGSIMDSWLHQGGYPFVQVQVQERSDLGASAVALTQEPFMFSPPDGGSDAIGNLWKVPTLLRTIGDGRTGGVSRDTSFVRGLIETGELVIELDGSGPAIVNAGGSGVYRVQYSPEHLLQLSEQLGELSTLERFYLFSDAWAAVLADKTDLAHFLSLAESLKTERDPDVWGQVTGPLAFMSRAVRDEQVEDLAAYARALVGPVFEDLGWESRPDDSERVRSLRAQLLACLGTVGADPAVKSKCTELHKAFFEQGTELDPELAPAIVATVTVAGGPEEYDAFFARYQNASTPQEELRYLIALAGFTDPALAERTFEFARTKARVQNAPSLLNMLLTNRAVGAATWERVTDHWDELLAKFPPTLVTRMLEGARLLCRDKALATQVKDFLSDHPVPTGEKSVVQICERLMVNATFSERLASGATPVLRAATAHLGA